MLEGTLRNATHTASEVKQRLQKAFETRESISNSRLKYLRVRMYVCMNISNAIMAYVYHACSWDFVYFMQVSQRGSILFFTVLSLQNLDPVYTFSSDWFMEVFRTCIQSIKSPVSDQSIEPPASNPSIRSNQSTEPPESDQLVEPPESDQSTEPPESNQSTKPSASSDAKSQSSSTETAVDSFEAYVDKIVNYLTLTVYQRVSYGLLSKHSLPFAFKLCSMLLTHSDETLASPYSIHKLEWMALLRDFFSADHELSVDSQHSTGKLPDTTLSMYKKLKPEVISYEVWEGATTLDRALPSFNGLLMHIIHNAELWVEFSKSEYPWVFQHDEEEVLYEGSITKSRRRSSSYRPFALALINRFHRLILINLFCPSQLAASVKWFIEAEMGSEYTARIPRDLDTIYQLTSSVKPALIIITPSKLHLKRSSITFCTLSGHIKALELFAH